MFTVLMIDDQEDLIKTVQDELVDAIEGITFVSCNSFDEAPAFLKKHRPDVIILDRFEGLPVQGDDKGMGVLKQIWDQWFCPVVVYTAGDVDLKAEGYGGHPFVAVQTKGAGSPKQVAEKLKEFLPHIAALTGFTEELELAKRAVLRDLAGPIFDALTDVSQRTEVLRRAARRRVAALVDELQHTNAEECLPWEQYIFPILAKHPLIGDVLRVAGSNKNEPENHRVILTPTCDLVPRGEKPCKATQVLVGKCVDPKRFVTEGVSLAAATKPVKMKEPLERALNEPHQSGFVIFPECKGYLPLMALDLRGLELIPIGEIGHDGQIGKGYHRIASVDSPFREYIGWAFLQISCRPGIPPRDVTELVASLAALFGKP